MGDATLRIGTRASPLALWQAEWVAARLREHGHRAHLVLISTHGDQRPNETLTAGASPGVFTKELQRALLDNRIDVAVHSLKDLPTDEVDGLCLAAVPERGPVGDALVSRNRVSLDGLPAGATVGTGSLRRRAQLLHRRRDLKMADIRGNVDTRVRKLQAGEFDAIVLAEAGLARLGLIEHISEILPASIMLPAVGQGALGLEARSADRATRDAFGQLDDPATHGAVVAERAMLLAVHGGCLAPVGAWGRIERGRLALDGVVLSADGVRKLSANTSGDLAAAERLGRDVANSLLDQGAAELIAQARNSLK